MAHQGSIRDLYWASVVFSVALLFGLQFACAQEDERPIEVARRFASKYCLDCHDQSTNDGGLDLDSLVKSTIPQNADRWESVVRKLSSQQMPPPGSLRPSDADYRNALECLTKSLDAWAQEHPDPGYLETFRRLTRTEYGNSIRDLLDMEIDVGDMLPSDESSHGFDNVTVTNLSPSLLERYVSAAREISRLAVGVRAKAGDEVVYRIPPDVTQDVHITGAPIGSRGGTVIEHNFPQNGEYEIQIRLMRDRNDEIESLKRKHEIDVLIDRDCKGTVQFERPPAGTSDKLVDADLKVRFQMAAGPHQVAVVFPEQSTSLLESVRQPLNVHYNFYRHPRIGPAIYQISIRGPYDGTPPADTPSRRRLFFVYPKADSEQQACAKQILSSLARRAYRRNVTDADLAAPMRHFHQAAKESGFEVGIESALSAILVSPHFLFRIEQQPSDLQPQTVYALGDFELATRLSYFLWSSLPDEELLDVAGGGKLRDPATLAMQLERMLADKKSASLTTNFAEQWLHLRNLDSFVPDMRLYPDFDDNLRQAMKRETELLFQSVVSENRSVMDLIGCDYSFLNERLAKHYGIPHVYGSHFRRIDLDTHSRRGGLLRQGSVLTVTSYATRTSPVLRGYWVLRNLLGSPPPPPPPNVPALKDNTVSAALPLRARLEQHRANAACAVCHNLLDPVGFALENFDAIGQWRERDNGESIDPSGLLWDGTEINGVDDLEQAILANPDLFVQTLTEKLMTYALGRGIEPSDAAAIRKIVRRAKADDYRFASIVLGITESVPFQMRTAQ
jgi:Protein of unknown function (DUF1592)/Protein of unknown function (DUF1588)/Protein of unknown function (DUF1585)/Protein of unknown function (DUF1587)/Protein of unknown function (DUF1595)/Planctomycete cytochrome C